MIPDKGKFCPPLTDRLHVQLPIVVQTVGRLALSDLDFVNHHLGEFIWKVVLIERLQSVFHDRSEFAKHSLTFSLAGCPTLRDGHHSCTPNQRLVRRSLFLVRRPHPTRLPVQHRSVCLACAKRSRAQPEPISANRRMRYYQVLPPGPRFVSLEGSGGPGQISLHPGLLRFGD